MNFKQRAVCLSAVLLLMGATRPDPLGAIKTELQERFPDAKVTEVLNTAIPGIYQVYSDGQVIYYAPAAHYLIFGELFNLDTGKSETKQAQLDLQAQQIAGYRFDDGLSVGTGAKRLIEFVDPDCPHCRAASQWLDQQPDGRFTQIVYFMPRNERAKARAAAVICAAPEQRRAALSNLWSANPHSNTDLSAECAQRADALLARQAEVAHELGVVATPSFVAQGQLITGFNRDQLADFLSIDGDHP